MGDFVKIGIKTGLIVVITAAIILVFTSISFPTLDFSLFIQYLKAGYAIAVHWCPVLSVVYPIAIALMGVRIAIWVCHFGLIAVRWIMKVNE